MTTRAANLDRRYGGDFRRWAASDRRDAYNSWGNGAAMRVSPVGYAYDSLDEVLLRAKWTAEMTHDHPEGIKGARATAAAIYLAHTGSGKDEVRDYIGQKFGYSPHASIDDLRPSFTFQVSCKATVPPAIIAFLESTDYEHAIRLALPLSVATATRLRASWEGSAQAYCQWPRFRHRRPALLPRGSTIA